MSKQLPAVQQKTATIRALFEKDSVRKQIAMAIPKHLSVDRLLRVAVTAIRNNPKLLDCTQESLLACVLGCAQLGLEPEPFLGQAYLVPFNNKVKIGNREEWRLEAQLIPGYRGYLALARRSGEVKSVTAQVVYTNDQFSMKYGLEEALDHVPAEGDRGNPKGAYVVFRYKDGSHSFDYMSTADIEKVRARSKSANSGPWVTDWDEMAKKTVIRRHIKVVPLSVEMATAVAIEDRFHAGESQLGILTDTEDADFKELADPQAEFDRLLHEKADAGEFPLNSWNVFMMHTASALKTTVEEVQSAASTPEEFARLWTAFEKWQKKQKPSEPSQETPTEKSAQTQGAGEKVSTAEPSAPTQGITKDNLTCLLAVPDDLMAEARKAFQVDLEIPLKELDNATAENLIAHLKTI